MAPPEVHGGSLPQALVKMTQVVPPFDEFEDCPRHLAMIAEVCSVGGLALQRRKEALGLLIIEAVPDLVELRASLEVAACGAWPPAPTCPGQAGISRASRLRPCPARRTRSEARVPRLCS